MQTWLLNVLWPTQYLTRKLNEFLCFQYNRRHTWKARSFTAFLAFCRCEQLNSYVGAGWVALAWVELTSGVKMPPWLGRCSSTEHNSRILPPKSWLLNLTQEPNRCSSTATKSLSWLSPFFTILCLPTFLVFDQILSLSILSKMLGSIQLWGSLEKESVLVILTQ